MRPLAYLLIPKKVDFFNHINLNLNHFIYKKIYLYFKSQKRFFRSFFNFFGYYKFVFKNHFIREKINFCIMRSLIYFNFQIKVIKLIILP